MVLHNPELNTNQPPKMVRGQIVKMLRQRGWKWNSIWTAMAEV